MFVFIASMAQGATETIEMHNKLDKETMVYSKKIINIDVGDTILWKAVSKGHNVEFIAGPEGFEIPKKSKLNKEYSMIFNIPGVYLYQCTPHKGLGMIALVVVGGDTSNKDDIANAKTFGKSKKILPDLINQL